MLWNYDHACFWKVKLQVRKTSGKVFVYSVKILYTSMLYYFVNTDCPVTLVSELPYINGPFSCSLGKSCSEVTCCVNAEPFSRYLTFRVSLDFCQDKVTTTVDKYQLESRISRIISTGNPQYITLNLSRIISTGNSQYIASNISRIISTDNPQYITLNISKVILNTLH